MRGLIKKLVIAIILITTVFACACAAPAESSQSQSVDDGVTAEPKGIATNITLSIGGGDGEVWAKAKNNFTLLPSKIWIYVELYSSETYQETYTSMKLEKTDYVKDLDIGKSITISVPTGGIQKYWQARMRYKFDNRDWVTKTTSTFLYSASGTLVEENNTPVEENKQPVASGTFYSLQEAYDKGFLTKENLQSIQQYHSSGFQNRPTPDDLNEDIAETIKRVWVKKYKEEHNVTKEITADINQYYGTYSGCIAVIMDRTDAHYPAVVDPVTIEISGVTFTYKNISVPRIVIYKFNN